MANNVSINVTAHDRTRPGFQSAQSSMQRLKMAAVALSPALIPISAQLAPIAVGAAAAGVAVAAFGAAIIPQMQAMGKASEAQKTYTGAVESHGKTSEQAAKAEEAWLKAVEALPPTTRQAAGALSVLKDQYKAWGVETSKDTMPVLVKSFGLLGTVLPKLTPVVKGVSGEFDRLLNRLAAGVNSSGFDGFMVKFTEFSTRILHKAVDGATEFGRKMAGLGGNSEFQRFMTYLRDTGPLVGDTLLNLGRAVANMAEGLSGSGVSILTVVNALAKLVAAVPPAALSVFIQAYGAFKLFSLGVGLVTAAASSQAIGRLVAFFGVMRAEGVASALSVVSDSMTTMQKAALGLGALVVAAVVINELAKKSRGAPPDVDRLTTSLKNLGEAGKFTGELRATFGDMDGFVRKVQGMRAASEMLEKTKPYTSLLMLGPYVDTAVEKLGDLIHGTKSLGATKDDLKAFDESFARLAQSGHADIAAAEFSRFSEALRATGMSAKQIAEVFPQYQASVAALKADQELAARSMGLFGEQAVATKTKLDAQKQSADGLRQAIQALNDVNRSALGGMVAFEASIDAAAKAAQENAGSLQMSNGALDLNDEKARAAASALQDLASKTDEAAGAARDNGESWATVTGIYERGRQQLIANGQQMGLTESQARSLAEQILRTPDKTAQLKGNMEDLQAKLNDARRQLASVPDSRRAQVQADISSLQAQVRQAQRDLYGLHDRTVWIRTYYESYSVAHPGGQAQAHGGIIGAAGGGPRSRMTLVGEQGPELVDLAPGSRVRSHPDSKRIADGMAGGGGGGPITIQLVMDGRRMAEVLVDPLRNEISSRGGNVQAALGRGSG